MLTKPVLLSCSIWGADSPKWEKFLFKDFHIFFFFFYSLMFLYLQMCFRIFFKMCVLSSHICLEFVIISRIFFFLVCFSIVKHENVGKRMRGLPRYEQTAIILNRMEMWAVYNRGFQSFPWPPITRSCFTVHEFNSVWCKAIVNVAASYFLGG